MVNSIEPGPCWAQSAKTKIYMVVSQNKETPKKTPIYYSPSYWDPQKGTPILGDPHIIAVLIFYRITVIIVKTKY